jgi:hypothetical protein
MYCAIVVQVVVDYLGCAQMVGILESYSPPPGFIVTVLLETQHEIERPCEIPVRFLSVVNLYR